MRNSIIDMREAPLRREYSTHLCIIFFLALSLRCAYWIFLKKNYFFYDHPGADVLYYQKWAMEIARGHWLGDRAFGGLPLYPYVLAVWDRLMLANMFGVRLMHILLGSVNCALTYAIARQIFPEGKGIALLSGLLMAASFTAIHYDWLMMPVPVIIALSLVIVLALLHPPTQDTTGKPVEECVKQFGVGSNIALLRRMFALIWKRRMNPQRFDSSRGMRSIPGTNPLKSLCDLKGRSESAGGKNKGTTALAVGLHREKITAGHGWLILGILAGMTALGDGKVLIFLALISIYLVNDYRRRGAQGLAKVFAPLLAGVLLILGANGLRQKIITGDWIWVSPQSGLSFYVGNHPKASGVFENPDFIRPSHEGQDADQAIVAQILVQQPLSPAGVSRFWRDQALAFIAHNPREHLRLLARKLALFASETENSYDLDLLFQREWKRYADVNPFRLVFPLAVAGMIAARRIPATFYPTGMILSQLILTLVFFLTHRHRATILPFLIMYEAYAVFWLIEQVQRKNIRNAVAVLAAVAFFIVAFRPQALPGQDVDFYRFTKSGAVYEKKKDWAKAQEHYQKALALRPDDTNTMYNLANVYALSANVDSARRLYEKILSLNPYQVDALYNLGFVQAQAGDYLQSLATFQRLARLQPDSPDVLFQLGRVAQKLGNCSEAKNYFERLAQFKPSLARELTPLMDQCRQD